MRPTPGPSPEVRRRRRALTLLVASVLSLVLLAAGVALAGPQLLARLLGTDSADYPGPGSGTAVVHVVDGASATDIGQALKTAGVVRSVGAFRKAAVANVKSRTLAPGYYRLRMQMRAADALALMLQPAARLRSRVTVPEGSDVAQTLTRIAKGSEVPAPSLRSAAGNPLALGLPSYARGQLEGFLFPATYDVEPGTGATEVLRMMTARFGVAAAEVDLEQAAAAEHLTPLQVVTLASIIERESAGAADRGKVAQVFLNRLQRGIPFGSEATVRYALGYPSRELTRSDIAVSSPYNTYRVVGFPPGPICSPGLAAIKAALHPTAGKWLYFFTRKDGTTVFSETQAGFERSQQGNR